MHSNHLSCQVSTVCHCYLLGEKFQPTNQPAILPLHLLHLDAFICFLYICCSDCTGGGNLLQNLSSSDPDDGFMLPWTSSASDPLRNDAVGISSLPQASSQSPSTLPDAQAAQAAQRIQNMSEFGFPGIWTQDGVTFATRSSGGPVQFPVCRNV